MPTPHMGRKPSGRVNFLLRVDKNLLSELREISKVQSVSISDLIERKILELIKEFDSKKGESHMRKNFSYEISSKNKIPRLQNENQAIQKIENLTIVFMKSQITARNGLAGI
ncbi:MAG: hypothetical protein QXT86_00300 [Archaeoglobaceae archaeon]